MLYTYELFDVVADCGFSAHSYADDTQIYVCIQALDHTDAIVRLATCVVRIREWMASNQLKLNEDKTQVIWLGIHINN